MSQAKVKKRLLENLKFHTYTKIGLSQAVPGQIGVIAVREIPKGVDPFKLSNVNSILPGKSSLVALSEEEVNGLPPASKELLKSFIIPDKGVYRVPKKGPNSFDGSYFLNSAGGRINASNCRLCPTKYDSR